MVLQFLQYGGMDRESEAVFRMRIDARNGSKRDDLCRWLQGYSPVFRPKNPNAIRGIKEILLTNIAKKA